jgi:hypothetical protein
MKMTTEPDRLDDLFAAARASAPDLPDELRTRILADADAMLNMRPPRRVGFGLSLRWAMPSLAGALTALAAGFWLGIALTDPVDAFVAPVWLLDTFDLIDTVAAPLLGLEDTFGGGF